ncbi:MAG: hypothetical protein AAGF95_19585, partial [Chloroflexota bacterium]
MITTSVFADYRAMIARSAIMICKGFSARTRLCLLVTSMLILSACGTTAIESTQEASTDSTDAPAATEVVEEP